MSLDNTITLSVDVDGSGTGTAANEAWSKFDSFTNRSVYHSPVHTPVMRDELTFYRTLPKPTASFYGTTKGTAKVSTDQTVDSPNGSSTRAPLIFTLSGATPVGTEWADVLKALARVKALIENEALMQRVFLNGEC